MKLIYLAKKNCLPLNEINLPLSKNCLPSKQKLSTPLQCNYHTSTNKNFDTTSGEYNIKVRLSILTIEKGNYIRHYYYLT